MAGDDFISETVSVSWFGKIIEALWGVLFGLALAAASVVGMFWNEGRAVQTFRSLAEGAGLVTTVEAAKVDPANAGKLIHVAGQVKSGAPLVDDELGVSAQALRLVRVVEMYQWKEHRETKTVKHYGGSEERITHYTYEKVWSADRIDSSKFKEAFSHTNPEPRIKRRALAARDAELGAFRPGQEVIARLPATSPLPVSDAQLAGMRGKLGTEAALVANAVYVGANPNAPRVGDLKISYRVAPAGPASIIGAQNGSDFASYQTKAGDRLLMVESGIHPADAMFKQAVRSNRIFTWVLRGVAVFVMWLGWFLVLRPLVVVADVVPFLGNVLGAGAGIVAFMITMVLAPLTIAIAWFFHRPLISAGVIAIGLLLAYLSRQRAAAKSAARTAAPAGPVVAGGAAAATADRPRPSFLPPGMRRQK